MWACTSFILPWINIYQSNLTQSKYLWVKNCSKKNPQNQKSVMTLIFCKTNKESSFSIKLWVWKLTLHIPLWITKIFCMGGWGVLFNCRLQFFSRTTWQIFNKTWHKASLGKYLQVNNWLNPLPRKNNEQNSALFFYIYKTMLLIENQTACYIRNNHTGFGNRLYGKLNFVQTMAP